MSGRRLLVVSDSPTLETGFGRVSRSLLQHWAEAGAFEEITVWGIGYAGWPYDLPYTILPAQTYTAQHWHDPENVAKRLVKLIEGRNFTHVWIMQDLFLLSKHEAFVGALDAARARGVVVTVYFPIDAPVERWEVAALEACTHAVAYTEYGAMEVTKHLRRKERVEVVHHGTDLDAFRMLPGDLTALRKDVFGPWLAPDDFLLVAVSAHQKRKGLVQTLQILQSLQDQMPRGKFKMYMHMPSWNPNEGTDLKVVAATLGLARDAVGFGDASFVSNAATLTDAQLNAIYNCADLFLTTTLGEGWGLPITEAMAAGIPVAGPNHTAVAEILGPDRGILLPTLGMDWLPNDNSRLRPRTDVDGAVIEIANVIETGQLPEVAKRGRKWARGQNRTWKAAADRFLQIMGVAK